MVRKNTIFQGQVEKSGMGQTFCPSDWARSSVQRPRHEMVHNVFVSFWFTIVLAFEKVGKDAYWEAVKSFLGSFVDKSSRSTKRVWKGCLYKANSISNHGHSKVRLYYKLKRDVLEANLVALHYVALLIRAVEPWSLPTCIIIIKYVPMIVRCS